jgi:hypothetical protein
VVEKSETSDQKQAATPKHSEATFHTEYQNRGERERMYRRAVKTWIRGLPGRQKELTHIIMEVILDERGGPEHTQAFRREVRQRFCSDQGWPCPSSSTSEQCPEKGNPDCERCQRKVNLLFHSVRGKIHAAGLLPLWWQETGRRFAAA